MKFFKKAICMLLFVIMCVFAVSCQTLGNVYSNTDYYTKEGELSASPYFAYYNDGKAVAGLEELDPEIAEEGPLDDGAFNVYFAVCNNSAYDRKINGIKVEFIKNSDNYDIVEPCEFTMDEETYIAKGQTLIIPCVFEKDFVKLEAKLEGLSCKTSLSYEGCVIEGDEPQSDEALAASVKELKFTSTNGIEGSFYIKNNSDAIKNIGKISFMLYTESGEKITKSPINMQVDSEINPDEMITLKYAVLPGLVSENIKETKVFDAVTIKITEE